MKSTLFRTVLFSALPPFVVFGLFLVGFSTIYYTTPLFLPLLAYDPDFVHWGWSAVTSLVIGVLTAKLSAGRPIWVASLIFVGLIAMFAILVHMIFSNLEIGWALEPI
jgi:hypothetical protein